MLQERIASRNDYLATYMLALYENQPSRQTHLTTSKKEVLYCKLQETKIGNLEWAMAEIKI